MFFIHMLHIYFTHCRENRLQTVLIINVFGNEEAKNTLTELDFTKSEARTSSSFIFIFNLFSFCSINFINLFIVFVGCGDEFPRSKLRYNEFIIELLIEKLFSNVNYLIILDSIFTWKIVEYPCSKF